MSGTRPARDSIGSMHGGPMDQSLVPYTALVRQFHAAPPGKLFYITGNDSSVFRLSLSMASQGLLRGIPIAVVDGSNRFDAYMIADVARQVTSNRTAPEPVTPDELLGRIFVARAFTCYQMEATVTERLPEFIRRINAPVAMIFGLLDTFYDEQAPLHEVKAGVGRIVDALRKMRDKNITVLLASQEMKLESRERNTLLPRIQAAMDQIYKVTRSDDKHHVLYESLKPRRSLHPGG
jgi:hypothetical protein